MYEWLYLVVKVSKRAKKCWKKPQIGLIPGFFYKIFGFANLIHTNRYNMRKKSTTSLYDFRNYIFPLGEVEVSFSNLLTTANNYRKILSDFFYQRKHWVVSIGMQKCAENLWFYVVKFQNFGPKMALFVALMF